MLMKRGFWIAVGASLAWLAVASIVDAGAQPLHDANDPDHWYPGWCCNLKDCRISDPGEIRWTPQGWLDTRTGQIIQERHTMTIPFDAPEEDKVRSHICRYLSGPSAGRIRCTGIGEERTCCLFIGLGG
jgi:hypothetical protein